MLSCRLHIATLTIASSKRNRILIPVPNINNNVSRYLHTHISRLYECLFVYAYAYKHIRSQHVCICMYFTHTCTYTYIYIYIRGNGALRALGFTHLSLAGFIAARARAKLWNTSYATFECESPSCTKCYDRWPTFLIVVIPAWFRTHSMLTGPNGGNLFLFFSFFLGGARAQQAP